MIHVGIPHQMDEGAPGPVLRAVQSLHPQHWYNWKWNYLGQPGYYPMLWQCKLGTNMSKAIAAAQANKVQASKTLPAADLPIWFLGNEPEDKYQSNTTPQEYADAARTWQAQVGGLWAGPGSLWWDGGREWIREYVRIGGPIPNIWAIHIYAGDNPQTWADCYKDAQRFFAELGYSRAIWVTETSGGETLMRYVAGRGDVTAYWYAAHDPFGPWRNADLTSADGATLTPLGCVFAGLQGPTGTGGSVSSAYLPVMAS